MITQNYLDPDVAYFLGMVVARGSLSESGGEKKITIAFPFRNILAEGIKKSFNQEEHLTASIYQIRERLFELIESDIQVLKLGKSVNLIIRFLRNSVFWRNIKFILGQEGDSQFDLTIPPSIFSAPLEIKKEFIRGVADVSGFIRDANNYFGQKRRVYIEISNKNWFLPVQLCALLQQSLNTPVQLIQWGHPNTRAPNDRKKRTFLGKRASN